MTIIQIDPLGTTTLLCVSSTIDDTVGDEDLRSTTYTGLTTTITSSGPSPRHVDVHMANRYVDSLSDTQLVQMVEMLDQKEEDMLMTLEHRLVAQSPVEGVPVVQAQPLTQQVQNGQTQPKVYQKTKNV